MGLEPSEVVYARTYTVPTSEALAEQYLNVCQLSLGIYAVLRIRDVYPGSRILIFTHPGSQIPDPKTATQERGEKKFVVIPLFVATNFTELKIILFLKC
jgi:hypothetical protein